MQKLQKLYKNILKSGKTNKNKIITSKYSEIS